MTISNLARAPLNRFASSSLDLVEIEANEVEEEGTGNKIDDYL